MSDTPEPENDQEPQNLGGRPKIELDLEELAKLCKIHCTAVECAAFFDCSTDTIDRRLKEEGWDGFAEFYKTHQGMGNVSLRRMQWKSAKKGNVTMQIFLGKQNLGQRDRVDHELSGKDGSPFTVNFSIMSDTALEELLNAKDRAANSTDGQ